MGEYKNCQSMSNASAKGGSKKNNDNTHPSSTSQKSRSPNQRSKMRRTKGARRLNRQTFENLAKYGIHHFFNRDSDSIE